MKALATNTLLRMSSTVGDEISRKGTAFTETSHNYEKKTPTIWIQLQILAMKLGIILHKLFITLKMINYSTVGKLL